MDRINNLPYNLNPAVETTDGHRFTQIKWKIGGSTRLERFHLPSDSSILRFYAVPSVFIGVHCMLEGGRDFDFASRRKPGSEAAWPVATGHAADVPARSVHGPVSESGAELGRRILLAVTRTVA